MSKQYLEFTIPRISNTCGGFSSVRLLSDLPVSNTHPNMGYSSNLKILKSVELVNGIVTLGD
jgi:hypothetical protein